MTYKVATPEQAYRSDNLYENRLTKAMDYLSTLLSAPKAVDFLKLVGHKPTYVIEYNMAGGCPEGVDDLMANRIVELFREAGWHEAYWQELPAEATNPFNPKWGYVFYFERPVESVPYQVMARLAKDAVGTTAFVKDESGNVRTTTAELRTLCETIVSRADGREFVIPSHDNGSIDFRDDSFKGSGVYLLHGRGSRVLLLDMGDLYLVYVAASGAIFYRSKENMPPGINFLALHPGHSLTAVAMGWRSFPMGSLVFPGAVLVTELDKLANQYD